MALMEEMEDTSLWFYRGEGNDTMVVGLRGKKLVLRLKKKTRQESNVKDQNCCMKGTEFHEKLLDFSKNVFLPLMGEKYVRVGELVRLPAGFAAKLDILCEPFRPKHRLHKGIDTRATCAIAMADFCLMLDDQPWDPYLRIIEKVKDNYEAEISSIEPTFSVEIKPKCGFIPSSPYIKKEHSIKHTTCKYCMLQIMKVSEGKYARPSQYCPVNLFSGDVNRVFLALKALVFDPQNNLRIFKDGFPIFTEEIVSEATKNPTVCCPSYVLEEKLKNCGWREDVLSTSPQNNCENHTCEKLGQYSKNFIKTILQILIDDSNSICSIPRITDVGKQNCKRNRSMSHIRDGIIEKREQDTFGYGGVLARLNLVQRMDDMDVEGLYPLYLKLQNYFEKNPKERDRFSVDGPYSAGIWGDVSRTHLSDEVLGTRPLTQNKIDSWSTRDIIFKLFQFAVASTANDCSMMLTFQKTYTKPKHLPFIVKNETSGANKEYVVYNIDLVDLDPKEFDRVHKYYNDSCKIVRHYLKSL